MAYTKTNTDILSEEYDAQLRMALQEQEQKGGLLALFNAILKHHNRNKPLSFYWWFPIQKLIPHQHYLKLPTTASMVQNFKALD